MTTPDSRPDNGIATQIVVGIVVTVVGGLILAFVQGWITWPPGGLDRATPSQWPPAEVKVFLDKLSGPPGTVVRTSGEGFSPGETVTIRFHTEQCAQTSADPSGTFAEVSCTIPKDWRFKGQFNIIASGAGSIRAATAAFRVT